MSQPAPIYRFDAPSMHAEMIKRIQGFRDWQKTPYDQQVIDELRKRAAVGLETYGMPLQPHNGRDAWRDALDELLDALVYVEQLAHELRDSGNEIDARIAEINSGTIYRCIDSLYSLKEIGQERKERELNVTDNL